MKRKHWIILLVLTAMAQSNTFAKDIIPAENSSFYYRIGGGKDFPCPRFEYHAGQYERVQ